MKKCSTAALALSLALTCIAKPADAGGRCTFLERAPDRHIVVPGDTLWDIASAFLAKPWCWTEVWTLNRDEIRDPHRIYPGQVIVFDRRQQRLGFAPTGGNKSVPVPQQLAPAVRSERLRDTPIPPINPAWREAVSELRLVAAGDESGLPRIVGFADGRRMAAAGDIALVDAGLGDPDLTGRRRDVVRILPAIIDPKDGRMLAMLLRVVGQVEFVRTGEQGLTAFRIVAARSELLAGDLLMDPATRPAQTEEFPRMQAATPFEGQVAAVLHGGRWAAQRDVVAVNRGTEAGLRAGSLVSVVRQVRIADHDSSRSTRPGPPSLSARTIATMVVVDTLERASLALVLRSEDAFSMGEQVRSIDDEAR